MIPGRYVVDGRPDFNAFNFGKQPDKHAVVMWRSWSGKVSRVTKRSISCAPETLLTVVPKENTPLNRLEPRDAAQNIAARAE